MQDARDRAEYLMECMGEAYRTATPQAKAYGDWLRAHRHTPAVQALFAAIDRRAVKFWEECEAMREQQGDDAADDFLLHVGRRDPTLLASLAVLLCEQICRDRLQ
jgi:hypothetical protein